MCERFSVSAGVVVTLAALALAGWTNNKAIAQNKRMVIAKAMSKKHPRPFVLGV
jgi:hypothetical protein